MKSTLTAFLLLSALVRAADLPQYTPDNKLVRPDDYREWIWLSSGLGMSYGVQAADTENPPFDNVFVTRTAYQGFVQTGRWPDKTMFVLEVRSSIGKGSINQHGHFQGDVAAFEVHVKDESRFKEHWAFFGFPAGAKAAARIPVTAACYSCHAKHAILDTTFVQFYPTALEIAKQKGTLTSEPPAQ